MQLHALLGFSEGANDARIRKLRRWVTNVV
jgi:hypothetical protein